MKTLWTSLLLLSLCVTVHPQQVDEGGAIRFYPEQEKQALKGGPLLYSIGVRTDIKTMDDGPGLFLGLQGSLFRMAGLETGFTASLLAGRGVSQTVAPYVSYSYGYGAVWLGYGLMLTEHLRISSRLNLGLAGIFTSTGQDSSGSGLVSGGGILIPELKAGYFISPVFSAGLSLKYHWNLSGTPPAGLSVGDVNGFSLGMEFNLNGGS